VTVRLVIIAAHPDDETIGASALMAAHETAVVHVTDGAPREARFWPEGTPDRESYAETRAREAESALSHVGAERIALGFVDQETPHALPDLASAIARVLEQNQPSLVVTHAYEGGHPDHDAVAFAVACAARLVSRAPHVWEMALYHGAAGALVAGSGACAPMVTGHFIDDHGSIRRTLAPAELARRRAMLASYESQRETLAPFVPLVHERFRPAPAYDFSKPPHEGPLHYERIGFPITGEAWRDFATHALATLSRSAPAR
jgi:LmbE family N-acetylglucosaminyl deacetylase